MSTGMATWPFSDAVGVRSSSDPGILKHRKFLTYKGFTQLGLGGVARTVQPPETNPVVLAASLEELGFESVNFQSLITDPTANHYNDALSHLEAFARPVQPVLYL